MPQVDSRVPDSKVVAVVVLDSKEYTIKEWGNRDRTWTVCWWATPERYVSVPFKQEDPLHSILRALVLGQIKVELKDDRTESE